MPANSFHDRKILLVRHGRTDWNAAHRFQGRSDIPLNETGLTQAEKLADRLASWPVDVVYTSPLTRASQTAAVLAERHRKVPIVLEDLVEINFGSWEGMHLKHLLEKERDSFRAWVKDPFFQPPKGAETWNDIRTRIESAVQSILKDGHEHIVVISHGGIMRALFVVLLQLDPHTVWNIKTSNCALCGIEVREHGNSMVFSNDDLHLRDIAEGVSLPVW